MKVTTTAATLAVVALAAHPAAAQLSGVTGSAGGGTGALSTFIAWLLTVMISIVTIGCFAVGLRMIFNHHTWEAVASFAIGALLIGYAATIVPMVMQ